MSKIITVSGGISSGKSKFAEKIAIFSGKKRVYIATSEITDDDMRVKIQKHIDSRNGKFDTIENFDEIDKIIQKLDCDVCMIDCVTNMINNIMYHSNIDFERCSNEIFDDFCDKMKSYVSNISYEMKKNDITFVIVTNEMGLSVIPMGRYTRRFIQLQGEINQIICSASDEVYFVISGIENRIK